MVHDLLMVFVCRRACLHLASLLTATGSPGRWTTKKRHPRPVTVIGIVSALPHLACSIPLSSAFVFTGLLPHSTGYGYKLLVYASG